MTDTTSTLNNITASITAMVDELENLKRKTQADAVNLRQTNSMLVSERFANGLIRDELEAERETREKLSEMVRKQSEAIQARDERIAELEAMLADGAWILSDIQR